MRDKMHGGSMIANVVSFSAAISAYEKGNQWEQALTLLRKMREKDMSLTRNH